jgi:hypothetical protein
MLHKMKVCFPRVSDLVSFVREELLRGFVQVHGGWRCDHYDVLQCRFIPVTLKNAVNYGAKHSKIISTVKVTSLMVAHTNCSNWYH